MTKFKRLGAMLLAVAMMASMAVTASATEDDSASVDGTYTVTFLKEDDSDESMADVAVNGDATVTTNTDGSVTISIPIKPIEGYQPMSFISAADGWITGLTVTGGTASIGDVVGGGNVNITNILGQTTGDVLYCYESATLEIVLSSFPTDGVLESVEATVVMLYEDSTREYFVPEMDATFDIQLVAKS